MARGLAEYILSDKAAAALHRENSHHPRIARSHAAKLAMAEIMRRFAPPADGERVSFHRPPPFMKELTIRFNTTYLSGRNDLQLDCRTLWRIFFRLQFGRYTYLTPRTTSLTHQAIYIQKRHPHGDDHDGVVQKRNKAATSCPIGPDYSTISKVTTIDQSGSHRLQYISKNLHISPHGSIDKTDIRNNDAIYDFLGISHKTLSTKTTGVKGVSRDGDIIVAFSNAAHFRNIESRLTRLGHFGGIYSLERNLAAHIMAYGTLDHLRLKGKIDDKTDTIRKFIRIGFGRIQRPSYHQNWSLGETTMPGVNVKAFLRMPLLLRQQLMVIFEEATKFTGVWHKDSFSDPRRNNHCAAYLNSKLGFPKSTSLFEFFDFFISRNTILPKHCDEKNCHRPGYNECCVYSYFTEVDGDQYKVSIVMTTRTTVGCAFDRAKK